MNDETHQAIVERMNEIEPLLVDFDSATDLLRSVATRSKDIGVYFDEHHEMLSRNDREMYDALLREYGVRCWEARKSVW